MKGGPEVSIGSSVQQGYLSSDVIVLIHAYLDHITELQPQDGGVARDNEQEEFRGFKL